MAKVHGVPGEWARVQGTVVGLWPVFVGVFALGFSLALAIFGSGLAGLALSVVALCGLGFALRRGVRRVERYFKGAKGEERVSGMLRDLPDDYHVFNDFVACGKHVDHVVVGPAGVYAVETKFWRGAVTVEDGHVLLDGQLPDRSPLTQVLKESAWVRKALSAAGWEGAVTPLLVFASDTFSAHRAEVRGAVVVNSCELKSCFDTRSVVLPQAELARLVMIMENN